MDDTDRRYGVTAGLAATAHEFAARGARVCVTGLQLDEPRDPATPAAYYRARKRSPESVAAAIREAGGSAVAIEADLRDDAAPTALFDTAEATFDAPASGGPDGFPGEASYGAAKAALNNDTMTAAAELGPVGVTANSLMPPVTDTGWATDPVREFVRDSWARHHVATPEDVATTIAWLCSDDAWLVTGNRLVLR